MPRVRRKGRQRRGYSPGHVNHLLHGRDFFRNGFGDDLDAMREAWPVLRDEVVESMDLWNQNAKMAPCVDDHGIIRPWGWYQFDCSDDITAAWPDAGLLVNGSPPVSEFEYLKSIDELSKDELRRATRNKPNRKELPC